MTDGVARELEQAEARMAEARDEAHMAFGGQASLSALTDAAIEVGRLRALAEVRAAFTRTLNGEACCRFCRQTWGYHEADDDCLVGRHLDPALAAREEAQGV